jgi:hypothetical protein
MWYEYPTMKSAAEQMPGHTEFVDNRSLEEARNASLLVTISFHFASERLRYLEEVLGELSRFPVKKCHIAVLTNTQDSKELALVGGLLDEARGRSGKELQFLVEPRLDHPHDLTWAHKKLITGKFLGASSRFSHFIYLEDDERLTFDNFVYFIAARKILMPFGLLPAFLRTEWSSAKQDHVSTDSQSPVVLEDRPFASARGHAFVCVDNPYCGSYILDRTLAEEYRATQSFSQEKSSGVSPWGVRERAAMGVTFESPPPPFSYRVVVPVCLSSRTVPKCAWLSHLPNNYADDAKSVFGTVAMNELFSGSLSSEAEVSLPGFDRQDHDLNLTQILKQFGDHSVVIKTIWAVGAEISQRGSSAIGDSQVSASACNSATSYCLGGDEQLGWTVTDCRSGPAPEAIEVLKDDAFFRGRLDTLLAPAALLSNLMPRLGERFPFASVIILSESASPGAGALMQRTQRDLFDRGLVAIGEVKALNQTAYCFLSSEAVKSISKLGGFTRGDVSMSSLGTNGRFANQLFQFAHVQLYALRHGLSPQLPEWQGGEFFDVPLHSQKSRSLPELRFDAFEDDDLILWELDNPPINIDLRGYFQEIPHSWGRHRPLLRRMFRLSVEHEEALNSWRHTVTRASERTLVAIHLRRGDYRDLSHIPYFRCVPEQWYLNWLRDIWPTLHEPLLFIATDEPKEILPCFAKFDTVSGLSSNPHGIPNHICDFEILRRADVLAISNSSFSRMAAILARDDQRCFCPSFESKNFAPYAPWPDSNFWSRFSGATEQESTFDRADRRSLRRIEMGLQIGKLRLDLELTQKRISEVEQEHEMANKVLDAVSRKRIYAVEKRLEKANKALDAVYKSRSWAVAKPLRLLSRLFGRC